MPIPIGRYELRQGEEGGWEKKRMKAAPSQRKKLQNYMNSPTKISGINLLNKKE
jgi:hypothetical protein